MNELRKALGITTDERIAQFIWNKMAESGYWDSPEANVLFFISDEDFMNALKTERI